MRKTLIALSLTLSVTAGAASAATPALDLPAGTLRDALAALSRQAGVNVAVEDERLWRRPVRAVRGRMSAEAALRRMLADEGARIMPLGGRNWRIVAVVRPAPKVRRAPPPPPSDSGAEIVVTASKRDTLLRDFSGMASVLSGRDLAFGGERGMDSILARLASLSSTHLGAGRNKLFIRGIADSSFTGPTQATVGQYLGDMRLTYNAPDPDLRLYDIASVEVLEGPQGTLYGAGSLGGIIRIVRNPAALDRPSAALSGGLSAAQHGDPGGDLGGMINLPLVEDRAALRVVGYGIQDGGYIDDVVRGRRDINRTRIAGGRASLRVDAGDDWTVDLGGIVQTNHGRDSQYADRDLPDLERASPTDGGFDADYWLGDVVVGKSWGDLSFLSSTGIVRQTLDERYDATMPDGPERVFAQRNRTRMIASENRLWRPIRGGYGWVLGASYTNNRTFLGRALGPPGLPEPTTGVTNRISEFTVYGEGSVELRRILTLTAGARYTHAKLSGVGEDVTPTVAALLRSTGVVAARREDTVLPSASVSLRAAPGAVIFARYQEGFRPGGLAIEGDLVRRFLNDRVRTIETGFRIGESGRSPFDLTVSFAHARWRDIQADYIDASGLPSTNNIGNGRIYSASAALGWRPVAGLTLDASVTYNDSKVTEPSAAFIQSLVNALAMVDAGAAFDRANQPLGRIPNVARLSARIGADYRTMLTEGIDLRVNGWARYTGKSRLGVGPVLGEEQGNYLDTALTARVGRPEYGVTLGLTNLFDTVGNRFALGTPFAMTAERQITPLRPRTLRLGFDAAF
ncbi:TonB-dependent receptor [Sphingomonas sp. ID0503]|uniref:TonB-dependent receptor n=1 Tax=Sphingomonas sp. ID0503 TaxID=3399691 RepID=UPI003AFA76BB